MGHSLTTQADRHEIRVRCGLVAPAINNALAALTGRGLRETPMTSERVKRALA
jgi:CO/xanthine dehydrogenase Mo-binding subunit